MIPSHNTSVNWIGITTSDSSPQISGAYWRHDPQLGWRRVATPTAIMPPASSSVARPNPRVDDRGSGVRGVLIDERQLRPFAHEQQR